jgi:uncharacterized phage protein (TIGR01671 family)
MKHYTGFWEENGWDEDEDHRIQKRKSISKVMREIKFRAWDGQRMYCFDNHAYTLDYNDISGWNVYPNKPDYKGKWTTGESSKSAELFCLMQYAGLKDKNGREIYEGDIIFDLWTKMVYAVKFGFCKKYAFNGWYCESEDRIASINGDNGEGQNSAIEIIGNIYEHEYLLSD